MKHFILIAFAVLATACGVSEAGQSDDAVPPPAEARLFGKEAGVARMTLISTVSLPTEGDPKVTKTEFIQYFVWSDWGKKTAKYQFDKGDPKATKTLMRLAQDGDALEVAQPSGLVQLDTGEFKDQIAGIYNGLSKFGPDTWKDPIYTDLIVAAGFKRSGEFHTVHNRECELVQVPVRRYCMWEGIALSDELYNAVTQNVGFVDGVYLGEVDARHFEHPGLAWPGDALADLENYTYE